MKCGTIESCVGCPVAPDLTHLVLGDESSVTLGEMADRLRWQRPLTPAIVQASFLVEGLRVTEDRVTAVQLAAERIGTTACKDNLYKGDN